MSQVRTSGSASRASTRPTAGGQPAYGGRELAQVAAVQRLRPVAEGGLGVRVHVDDHAVRADRDRGAGQRDDEVLAAGGVATGRR